MRGLWVFITPLAVVGAGLYFIPWKNASARRRACWLLLLPGPALALVAFGPLGFLQKPYGAATKALLMQAQHVGIWLSIALGLALLALLKDLRRSALLLGGVAAFATFAVSSVNLIIIDPSS